MRTGLSLEAGIAWQVCPADRASQRIVNKGLAWRSRRDSERRNRLDRGLRSGCITAICRRMRYAMTILAVLFCLGNAGCVSSDKKVTPPDHVIDPRGQ